MAAILTRETIAEAREINIGSDTSRSISLNVSRGNVAIINEVQLEAHLRTVTNTGVVSGVLGVSLDSGLAVATDLPGMAGGSDDDIENDAAILERLYYTFGTNADDVNGVGATTSGPYRKTVNYRRLSLLERPMTSEDPELLANVQGVANTANLFLTLYYQVVRLTQNEIGNLAAAILAPSARVVRFASVPENGGFNGPEIRLS